jgi:hypothetical protein
MRVKTVVMFLIVLALATAVWAQTKITGTLQCGKADPAYAIPVGDRPDHAFSISKVKCTWSNAPEIAGTAAKDHDFTAFNDVSGNRGRSRTAAVGTMANGDKYFSVSQGTVTLKEGVPQSHEGTWSYTGGTGKLKGIKGKGTYKGAVAPDGTMTIEVEGEYELPK